MRRRDFIKVIVGSAGAWPLAAGAQQAGELPTIGFLGNRLRSRVNGLPPLYSDAAHEIRVGDQPQGRQGAWSNCLPQRSSLVPTK